MRLGTRETRETASVKRGLLAIPWSWWPGSRGWRSVL